MVHLLLNSGGYLQLRSFTFFAFTNSIEATIWLVHHQAGVLRAGLGARQEHSADPNAQKEQSSCRSNQCSSARGCLRLRRWWIKHKAYHKLGNGPCATFHPGWLLLGVHATCTIPVNGWHPCYSDMVESLVSACSAQYLYNVLTVMPF